MRNEYKTLGVPFSATNEQIKEKYREIMRTCHPDKGGTAEQAAEMSAAYHVLTDRRARQTHDKVLALSGIVACGECQGTGAVRRRKQMHPCEKCQGRGY